MRTASNQHIFFGTLIIRERIKPSNTAFVCWWKLRLIYNPLEQGSSGLFAIKQRVLDVVAVKGRDQSLHCVD